MNTGLYLTNRVIAPTPRPDWPRAEEVGGDGDALRILFPFNGSRAARAALDAVNEVSDGRPTMAWVLYVRQWDVKRGPVRVCLESAEEARQCVQAAVAALRLRGVSASGLVRNAPREHVAEVIVGEAERLHVDCIAMGANGHRALIGALTGSVPRRVARRATRRVILLDSTPIRAAVRALPGG